MDFELKTLDLDGACADKCDALVVLVADGFKPGRGALSRLVAVSYTHLTLPTNREV